MWRGWLLVETDQGPSENVDHVPLDFLRHLLLLHRRHYVHLPLHQSLIKANSIAKDEDKEVICEQLDILVRVVQHFIVALDRLGTLVLMETCLGSPAAGDEIMHFCTSVTHNRQSPCSQSTPLF